MKLADPTEPVKKVPEKKLEDDRPPEYTSQDVTAALKNGGGFAALVPEVEKLLTLCAVLNTSLDALMADELPPGCRREPIAAAPSESILIAAENGTNLVRCVNVLCSQPYNTRRGPRYSLFGVSDTLPFQVGNSHLLGWYADEASVQAEIKAIQAAMRRGDPDYTLQYAVKVRRRLGRIEIEGR